MVNIFDTSGMSRQIDGNGNETFTGTIGGKKILAHRYADEQDVTIDEPQNLSPEEFAKVSSLLVFFPKAKK